MDLRLNEDQEMFKKVAADFVQAEAPTTMLTQQFLKKETFLPDLYAKIAGLGWLGMLMPEQYGGAGLSYLDCGVVFEELGRAPVPGPVFSSGVLAAQIIPRRRLRCTKGSPAAGHLRRRVHRDPGHRRPRRSLGS